MELFQFISGEHLWVLHIAALIRLIRAYSYVSTKLRKEKKNFVWQIYFSDRWDDWALHVLSMWLGLMVLPGLVHLAGQEFFPALTELGDNPALNLLATAVLGFAGYDVVRWMYGKFKKKDNHESED